MSDKSAVEKLADEWDRDGTYDGAAQRDIRAAIEADREAEVGAYGRAVQTISEMQNRHAEQLQKAWAEVERLRGEREAAAEQFDAECEYTATLRAEVERLTRERDAEYTQHRLAYDRAERLEAALVTARRDTAEAIVQAIESRRSEKVRVSVPSSRQSPWERATSDAYREAQGIAREHGQETDDE